MNFRVVDEVSDAATFLALEAMASAPYGAFVYESREEEAATSKLLFEAGAAEFAPPFARVVVDDAGATVGMYAGPFTSAQIGGVRFKAARALRNKVSAATIERMKLAGGTMLKLEPDDQYISRIAVLESRRGQGIAKIALNHFIALAKERGGKRALLEVDASAEGPQRLYASVGFEAIGDHEANDPATGRRLVYRHMARAL